jgi:competence protein ComEA
MTPRLARALLLAALAAAPGLRLLAGRPSARPACSPEGRGAPPRHWLGCAADPGPRRALSDEERLLLHLPLDPNTAQARGLAFVPGLSRRLAEAVVEERGLRGPFGSVDDLRRVAGLGAKRLEQARGTLRVGEP